jgi:hypothetical protein
MAIGPCNTIYPIKSHGNLMSQSRMRRMKEDDKNEEGHLRV